MIEKLIIIFLTLMLIITLSMTLLCVDVHAEEAWTYTMTCIVPDGQFLNVRNQPRSSAASWGIMHTGDTITVNPDEIHNGFFRIDFKGHVGYVSVKFFEIPENDSYMVISTGRVRVRKSPNGQLAKWIQPDTIVNVQSFRFAPDGTKWARYVGGYILSEYLDKY